MKNKIMEREFFGSVIHQRIDNEMLSVSDLSKIYEGMREERGWPEKPLHRFFDKTKNDNTAYITELVREGKLIKDRYRTFMDVVEKNGVLKALKEYGLYKMTGKGSERSVYCHPYIFVAIAMWMNPTFRAKATIWIADQLIVNRIEAGERYTALSTSIHDHIVPSIKSDTGKKFIYSNFAKLINKKIFGKHADDLRQVASKEDLKELTRLQEKLITLIEVGYISNYWEAKEYISKL